MLGVARLLYHLYLAHRAGLAKTPKAIPIPPLSIILVIFPNRVLLYFNLGAMFTHLRSDRKVASVTSLNCSGACLALPLRSLFLFSSCHLALFRP